MTTSSEPTVIGRECKHAIYVEAQDRSRNDLVFVKELVHMSDGTFVPNTRCIENYRRDFWVTRELHRKYKDKKEWNDISKLQKFTTTQIDLVKNAALALNKPQPMNGQLRRLARSPYLYGCDISTPALIKRQYMDHFKDLPITDSSVAVSDCETDMLTPGVAKGAEKIIMQAVTMKDRVFLVIVKSFFDGWDLDKVHVQLQEALQKYMGEVVAKRGIKMEVLFVDHEGDVAHEILQKCHQWKPDFLSFWNMDFDIQHMEQALVRRGYDPAKSWSDPSVPKRYQSYAYKQGPSQKKTASGKTMPLSPAERWHSVYAPTSFYVMDSMCVYLKLRIAKGKEQSYSLNAVLAQQGDAIQKGGLQKMHFDATDHLSGGDWHMEMQKNHKIEYCIYNVFDCVAVEILDEHTTDLSRQVPLQCEHSEYNRLPSQPRRTCDDLHFVALAEGKVIATTSDEMIDELDQYVIGHDNWIVTLRSDLAHDDGLQFVMELPGHKTYFRRDVADLDVAGTYPNEEIIFNISKETTAREICQIVGVSEALQRATGINLSGGYVNAVEIYTSVFKAPSFDQMLSYYRQEDTLPPEFDEHMRKLMAEMETVEEFIEDVEPDDEEEMAV